ncbi:hypothetical protein MK489_02825 [Myxococcota bacterium]|nr:hypothetical protein [Myxococcota bacterium]
MKLWREGLTAKLAMGAVFLVVPIALLELIIRVGGFFTDARDATRIHASQVPVSDAPTTRFLQHPFLGYTGNPRHPKGLIDPLQLRQTFGGLPSDFYLRNQFLNAHGYPSEHEDYFFEDDGFEVGVFGGSVAEQLATVGGGALIRALEEGDPELHGRVRILNLAIGGYKQPQQLIGLTLMGLQGVSFDAVINLDGFNEVALSGADADEGYNPIFPSRDHYSWLLAQLGMAESSSHLIEAAAEIISERRRADEWRRFANDSLLNGSELARTLTGVMALSADRRAVELEVRMQNEAMSPDSVVVTGHPCLDEEGGCWELIANLWEDSSRQMAGLSERMGARYVHVLQPNQYVEGSKLLTSREREIAFDAQHSWRAKVRDGYPVLQARIPAMQADGINVQDLTDLFGDTPGDIYVDQCCHYNREGSEMLARAIAEQILVSPRSLVPAQVD